MNRMLDSDIEELIAKERYFVPLENTSILVTGSTGLIGSIIVKSLCAYAQKTRKRITVYASCRSREKFDEVFSAYKTDTLIPLVADITDLDISNIQLDYIIHGASITSSKLFVEKPVETINTALDGTKNLLKQCVDKKLKGFVYLSSLEVYGQFPECVGVKNVKEIDSGYIDPMAVRSCYSEGKRMVENMCKAYEREYCVPVKVARLCQVFGAGVLSSDNRVFAQFARSIIEHKDIILKTQGETVRNYCYTADAVTGILTVLVQGTVGEAYNIANMDTTISIADMAVLFCKLFPESQSKVVFDIAENIEHLGYNPVVKVQLDSAKLQSLGWQPSVHLDEMINRLVKGMSK